MTFLILGVFTVPKVRGHTNFVVRRTHKRDVQLIIMYKEINYILQLIVSRFHDHQAILQSEEENKIYARG